PAAARARSLSLQSPGAPGDLHSFPTRRSSDLTVRPFPKRMPPPIRSGRRGGLRPRVRPRQQVALPPVDAHGLEGEGLVLGVDARSEEHTSELQSLAYLVCRLLLEKKNEHIPSS